MECDVGLFGIDGFVVTAQPLDEASGEWWLGVETLEDRAWCESCAVRAVGIGSGFLVRYAVHGRLAPSHTTPSTPVVA